MDKQERKLKDHILSTYGLNLNVSKNNNCFYELQNYFESSHSKVDNLQDFVGYFTDIELNHDYLNNEGKKNIEDQINNYFNFNELEIDYDDDNDNNNPFGLPKELIPLGYDVIECIFESYTLRKKI